MEKIKRALVERGMAGHIGNGDDNSGNVKDVETKSQEVPKVDGPETVTLVSACM